MSNTDAGAATGATGFPDLAPAAERLARIVTNIPEATLDAATPCPDYTVGDLLDHVGGLSRAFVAAAVKRPVDAAPAGNADNLDDEWRATIPTGLRYLVDAWRDPQAWTGMTAAGGVELPGEVAGAVVLDELVVHGWDLAVATDQPADFDGPGLDAVEGFLASVPAGGTDGLFGPAVDVAPDASRLERIIGRSGRDPKWRRPA